MPAGLGLDGEIGPLGLQLPHGLSVRPYVRHPALHGEYLDDVAGEVHRAIPQGLEGGGRLRHALAYPLAERLLQVAGHVATIGRASPHCNATRFSH